MQFGKDKDIKPSNKTWFYFSISGTYNYLPVKLYLQKTNTLSVAVYYYFYYRLKFMICIDLLSKYKMGNGKDIICLFNFKLVHKMISVLGWHLIYMDRKNFMLPYAILGH